jgi:ribosomal protein L30/L7E
MALPFSTWGRSIGIEVKSTVSVVDCVSTVDQTKTFYAGRAVTIDSTSKKLIPVEANLKPLGLAKFNKNTYVDETLNNYGMMGSGLGTTVMFGTVEVSPNYFTIADGTEVVVDNFVAGMTAAAPLAPIYVVTAAGADLGKLTPTLVAPGPGQNELTVVGYLLVAPTTETPIMKMFVQL